MTAMLAPTPVDGGGREDGEFTVRRRDGSTFLASVRDRLMYGRDGEAVGTIGVSVDVTERAASERALAAARDYLRAVTESMGQGLFTLDSDGRVTYINATAEELLGWPHGELDGQLIHDLTHTRRIDGTPLAEEDRPIVPPSDGRRALRVEDDVFVRRDGLRLPVAYTAAPFATAQGVEGFVVVFDDISERKAQEEVLRREADKLLWIGRIQDALAEERFVLFAQPIVDLSDGEVVQSELLLRLREPDGEIVAPGSFLPVAEQFGLIGEIDRWVVARGTAIAATGRPVEINLSARSVGDRTILDHIERCLEVSGADPTLVVFEFTETAIVEDEHSARLFAERLRHLGCKLALDDFGTGYGGFTYLKHMPVDFLKIDIEFVRDLAANPASGYVVEAVVALARGFGLQTIAEGVEDADTLGLLGELGVDFAQGYHLGPPALLDEPRERKVTA
jgi:PAS domain S-box-containing protein